MTLFDAGFWRATTERTVRTVAQSALAVLGAGATGVLDAPWLAVLSTAGMAGVLALLTALAVGGPGQGPGVTEHLRPTAPGSKLSTVGGGKGT
ncbi:holin [Streptomyces sp. NPDC088768]|uniref:holin n=1 Tax=Streptomyces sp. NPDC088768 TaxID=3365894 RepID=UPI00380DD825